MLLFRVLSKELTLHYITLSPEASHSSSETGAPRAWVWILLCGAEVKSWNLVWGLHVNGNPLQYSCLEYSIDRGAW